MILRYLYNANQPIAAMLCLVLLILVFIFFQMRWFQNLQLKGSSKYVAQAPSTSSGGCGTSSQNIDASVNANWPPIINICPDYMVTQNGSCVDPAQLYGNQGGGNGAPGTRIPVGDTNCANYSLPYLRWEGVVERQGQCIQSKIRKA